MTFRQFSFTLLASMFIISGCKGQDNRVFEIPFTLDKKLLVFKGQLNGVETSFAFDTGAAEGIATSNEEKKNGIERKNSTQRISDGNNEIAYLQTGITKELSIGDFKFKNVRATISDMQYLQCMDLYLLGAYIIRQLNWEIDFERMRLKVSKSVFETTVDMPVIPLSYEYNTTRTKMKINSMDFKNVLIDFGYVGVMEIPTENSAIKQFIENKKTKNLVATSISSTFAALGMSKPSVTEKIIIDSVNVNGQQYYNIPAEFRKNVSIKIGVAFFNSTCKKVIINNNDKKIYLQLKNSNDFKNSFPISVLLRNGKLKIAATSISDSSIANNFVIDEEIDAINGKQASDFKSECDYLNWYYLTKREELKIKKISGQEIEIRRSPNR